MKRLLVLLLAILLLTACRISREDTAPEPVVTEEIPPATGDTYTAVLKDIILGKRQWDADMIAELEQRYNAAYQDALHDGVFPKNRYCYNYTHAEVNG